MAIGLLVATPANSAPVMPVLFSGIPMVLNHPTVPGEGTTKSIDLTPLGSSDSLWNVNCNYEASETGNGALPISILILREFWADYDTQMYVDGQNMGPPLLTPTQTTLGKKVGTILFTNVDVYKFKEANNLTPEIVLTNVDGTGNFTITSCSATFLHNLNLIH